MSDLDVDRPAQPLLSLDGDTTTIDADPSLPGEVLVHTTFTTVQPKRYCLQTPDTNLSTSESSIAHLPTRLHLAGLGGDESWTLGSGPLLFLRDPAQVRSLPFPFPVNPKQNWVLPPLGNRQYLL